MSQIVRVRVDRRAVTASLVARGVAIVLVGLERLGLGPESWRARPISRDAPPSPPDEAQ